MSIIIFNKHQFVYDKCMDLGKGAGVQRFEPEIFTTRFGLVIPLNPSSWNVLRMIKAVRSPKQHRDKYFVSDYLPSGLVSNLVFLDWTGKAYMVHISTVEEGETCKTILFEYPQGENWTVVTPANYIQNGALGTIFAKPMPLGTALKKLSTVMAKNVGDMHSIDLQEWVKSAPKGRPVLPVFSC